MASKKLLFLAAFLFRCFSTAYADPIVSGPTVALGTDYFQTQPGTQFNFGPSIGIVGFRGLPIGPFSTDTIVQRQADALINGPAIPIQITALSLQSMQPVMFNGNLYHVFVTLDPAHLLQDTGTLSVQGTLAGGYIRFSPEYLFPRQLRSHRWRTSLRHQPAYNSLSDRGHVESNSTTGIRHHRRT